MDLGKWKKKGKEQFSHIDGEEILTKGEDKAIKDMIESRTVKAPYFQGVIKEMMHDAGCGAGVLSECSNTEKKAIAEMQDAFNQGLIEEAKNWIPFEVELVKTKKEVKEQGSFDAKNVADTVINDFKDWKKSRNKPNADIDDYISDSEFDSEDRYNYIHGEAHGLVSMLPQCTHEQDPVMEHDYPEENEMDCQEIENETHTELDNAYEEGYWDTIRELAEPPKTKGKKSKGKK